MSRKARCIMGRKCVCAWSGKGGAGAPACYAPTWRCLLPESGPPATWPRLLSPASRGSEGEGGGLPTWGLHLWPLSQVCGLQAGVI